MRSIEREFRKLAIAEGFQILDCDTTRRHVLYTLADPAGRVSHFRTENTPGDYRWLRNKRAELRRIKREG